MNSRLKIIAIFASVALAFVFSACTDTTSTSNGENGGNNNGGECDAGQEFDSDLEECVPTSNGGDNNNNNGNNNNNNNNNFDPNELDPWDDESGDGIPNQYDNCPLEDNPDQLDTDADGVGDVCDNCPEMANPDQEADDDNPVDDRGIVMGDTCAPGSSDYADKETDTSGDGVPDIMDNCPDNYNPPLLDGCSCPPDDIYCTDCLCQCPDNEYPCSDCRQLDTDGDGVGDKCDNCPDRSNPNQTNTTGDDFGDACAPEPENIPICENQNTEFEVLEPNVYMLIDQSGSMDFDVPTRWTLAKQGLDVIADDLHDEIRFGIGAFSGSCDASALTHELNMNSYNDPQTLKNTYHAWPTPVGGTPIADALEQVAINDYVSAGPGDDERVKAVLLVTDGDPSCGAAGVVNMIENLHDNYDILTFVVGFSYTSQNLNDFAEAGGTDDPYLANDGATLADAMRDVADLLVTCDYTLDQVPPDPNKIWINVDGSYLDPDSYTYDSNTDILSLNESTCDYVRSFDQESLEIEIEMGCATDCVEEQPEGLCDVYYETCGAPYECTDCSEEVCDGVDNNCDGQVDEGCPECSIYEGSCESDSDCCGAFVCNEAGTCDHECYPTGAACTDSSQCCGDNTCAILSGDDVGACISG